MNDGISTLRPADIAMIEAIRRIYDRHCAGCCLHIVFDDQNVADRHVEHCIGFAQENDCADCEATARILLSDYTMLERWALVSVGQLTDEQLAFDGFIS